MGQYDRTMKLLVDTNPEAMARFVLHEWRKQQEEDLPETQITAVTLLSEEFQGEELKGDGVWLIEGPEGPLYLVEIEYQSVLDTTMPLRSLEYLARAKKKHWKTCGKLPVIAVVIYLFDEMNMPDCPLHWPAPHGQTAMVFHYLIIKMKELPREDLLALREPALWPLILLTGGTVDRILIEEMFAELLEQKLYNTLPLSHTIAAWFLQGDDLTWLNKEYQKMYEFFKDSPALQWMEESGRADERKKADQRILEERKKAALEERKKANQRALEERKKANQRALEERKKTLITLKQTVIELVSQRFPTLKRLAKVQVQALKQPELFQQVFLRLSLANDVNEAQNVLLSLNENEEAEEGN